MAAAVVIAVLTMGPFVLAFVYSSATGTSYNKAFLKFAFYFPYMWILVIVVVLIGVADLGRKRL